ncbi:S-adenosyl-L-methionine-dependent methyltransferase [Trichodelitschia bisporula]|uniref:S-adenosyl-L-methionine-dependent methyltransferase n=1 Tax=Trichodelitschia bisporula TaxID=703511 RepID=A0A6G1I5W8_9PEZI|nr:S-adenosyl-L-methionine-dependent methyltransferase [Trichodelitschia bisporula]
MAPTTEPPPTLGERIASYVGPFTLLATGFYYFATTAVTSPVLALTQPTTFKHKAFARLWSKYGTAMSLDLPGPTVALLSTVSGTVLDLGPGSGALMHYFDASKVKSMYGAEPAVDMHPLLRSNATAAGFDGKYEVLNAGAEKETLIPALGMAGLLRRGGGGVFDEIVCVRVLCGVPHLEDTVKGLHELLKPGGRLVVCEHVKNSWPRGGGFVGAMLQRLYTLLGWPVWMAGCSLNRDTEAVLRKVGGKDGWEKIDLQTVGAWKTVPFIVGTLVKKA